MCHWMWVYRSSTSLLGSDLSQREGEASCSTAIVDAQLTPPISRDDDAERQDAPPDNDAQMPDAPFVHDIATLRGRCRCGLSAHIRQQTNASALPAVCAVSNAATGKRVCNSGAMETLNVLTFTPTVHGGVGHIRVAADTEVLLPFAQDSDQASTAAPAADDEQDLFGREDALRTDEEVMDFQWFQSVSWDSIKGLRGTTYVQPPPRFKFALQQARHAILRAIMHNNPSSLACEPAWKALVLSSWLLLGPPAVSASENNCAHYVESQA